MNLNQRIFFFWIINFYFLFLNKPYAMEFCQSRFQSNPLCYRQSSSLKIQLSAPLAIVPNLFFPIQEKYEQLLSKLSELISESTNPQLEQAENIKYLELAAYYLANHSECTSLRGGNKVVYISSEFPEFVFYSILSSAAHSDDKTLHNLKELILDNLLAKRIPEISSSILIPIKIIIRDQMIYVFTKKMEGTLDTLLLDDTDKIEKTKKIITISKQFCTTLSILHKNGYAHHDLKPENIFLENENPLKIRIGDFGESFSPETDLDSFGVTSTTKRYLHPISFENSVYYNPHADLLRKRENILHFLQANDRYAFTQVIAKLAGLPLEKTNIPWATSETAIKYVSDYHPERFKKEFQTLWIEKFSQEPYLDQETSATLKELLNCAVAFGECTAEEFERKCEQLSLF